MVNSIIEKSLLFAEEKHKGQTRIGGDPYITHPIEVAEILKKKGFFEAKYLIAAYFHDLKEDTDATDEEILSYGGEEVLKAVTILTKTKGYKMKEYIEEIQKNFIAKMVKLADRLHNLLCAVVANEKFRKRYIKETEEFYIDLSKGTPFEEDILNALNALKNTI